MSIDTKKPADKTVAIVIRDVRLPRWFRAAIAIFLWVIIPIGIGIIVDSPAMQWIGFILAILCIGAMLHLENKKTTFKTVDEAIEYLKNLDSQ